MTQEEHNLLVENNQMLHQICNYLNYKYVNYPNNILEYFIVNLAADRFGNKMGTI